MARVVFMGSKASGLAVLNSIAALMKTPHELVGVIVPNDVRDERSITDRLVARAQQLAVPLVVGRNGADDRALNLWRADLAIVVGWYRLVPLDRYPGTAFYALHYSALPRYRGNAPVVWQIIRGESTLGVTLFRFGAGVDDGDIAGQSFVPLSEDETIGDVLPRLDAAAVSLLERSWTGLLSGKVQLRPQRDSDATFGAARGPDDGEVDWRWSARQTHNFVRAQSHPYPGAFSFLPDGRRIYLWRTSVEPRQWFGPPGMVVDRVNDAAVVACGYGAVRVWSVQPEGDREVSGAELMAPRARLVGSHAVNGKRRV